MWMISVALAFLQWLCLPLVSLALIRLCSIFSYTLTVPEQRCPGENLDGFCLWSRLRPVPQSGEVRKPAVHCSWLWTSLPLCSVLLALGEKNIQTAFCNRNVEIQKIKRWRQSAAEPYSEEMSWHCSFISSWDGKKPVVLCWQRPPITNKSRSWDRDRTLSSSNSCWLEWALNSLGLNLHLLIVKCNIRWSDLVRCRVISLFSFAQEGT